MIWAIVIGIPAISIGFQVWSLVGIWRSSDRYQSAGGLPLWAIFSKIIVGVICVLIALSIFSMISMFSGSRY